MVNYDQDWRILNSRIQYEIMQMANTEQQAFLRHRTEVLALAEQGQKDAIIMYLRYENNSQKVRDIVNSFEPLKIRQTEKIKGIAYKEAYCKAMLTHYYEKDENVIEVLKEFQEYQRLVRKIDPQKSTELRLLIDDYCNYLKKLQQNNKGQVYIKARDVVEKVKSCCIMARGIKDKAAVELESVLYNNSISEKRAFSRYESMAQQFSNECGKYSNIVDAMLYFFMSAEDTQYTECERIVYGKVVSGYRSKLISNINTSDNNTKEENYYNYARFVNIMEKQMIKQNDYDIEHATKIFGKIAKQPYSKEYNDVLRNYSHIR